MTDKEKKVVFTLIAIMVLILIIVIFVKSFGGEDSNTNINTSSTNVQNNDDGEKYTIELNDGTKLNNSENLKTAKTYKTVEISDIQITSENGNTTILANVKNTGTTEFAKEYVTLTLLGDNGEVVTTVTASIPKTAPGETTQLNSKVSADIANIKDFTITEKK